VVVVFDGHRGGAGPQTRSVRGGVEIYYSGLGDSADSVIKRMVAGEKKNCVVITSDGEIARYAWSHDAVPVESERFARILERKDAAAPASTDYEDDEDEYDEQRRGGNPYRLSKRDRAIRRALGKL